ncbi:MAG: M20/M25/M40 family metallo-hydrolase, partial [Gemmatimonadota bacterium]
RSIASPLHILALGILLVAPVAACHGQDVRTLPESRLLSDLESLAADAMEGRRTGTTGNALARQFLLNRLEEEELSPLGTSGFEHPFPVVRSDGADEVQGVNLAAAVEGRSRPGLWTVITAHYDHLGVREDEVFNGADDNASGTAALLHLASHFRQHPPMHSILFLFVDAEEMGLQGARAFIQHPLISLDSVVLNVNLDMVSRSPEGELYVAGTHHTPALRARVQAVPPGDGVTLLFGHDSPDLPPGDDWTLSSDHGPFHQAGIPFLYFGVEDHPGYHHPSDTFENVTPRFYQAAVGTIGDIIRSLDPQLPELLALKR